MKGLDRVHAQDGSSWGGGHDRFTRIGGIVMRQRGTLARRSVTFAACQGEATGRRRQVFSGAVFVLAAAMLVAGAAAAAAAPVVIGSPIPVGDTPYGVAVNEATNRIYVTNTRGDSVSVIDGATGTVGSSIAVGDQPGRRGGQRGHEPRLRRQRQQRHRERDRRRDRDRHRHPITVGDSPYGVAVNETTNRVYVTNRDSDSVSVIDGATGTVIGNSIAVGDSPTAWRSTRPRTASTSPTTTATL